MNTENIDPAVLKSIQAIVNYNWHDELRDYEENGPDSDHVFEHLQRVDAWLEGKTPGLT